MEISNYWMIGVWKNLHINGGGGGVEIKIGGNPFPSNLVPQKILTKLPTFDSMSQKYSASVFQDWHKIHFLYISMFVV